MNRPTLADVAALSGVSLKTASRAINNEYGVAPATARRVLAAASSLGFRPNQLARTLASRRTSAAVGLIIPDLSDPFIAALAAEVDRDLDTRDLQFMAANHGDDAARQRRRIRTLVERRVDALVIVTAPGDASYLRTDIEHGLVVVAVDRPLDGVAVDTVVVDNEKGARTAVAGMVADGHTRIALLSIDTALWTTTERIRGYRLALADAGIPADPELIRVGCRDLAEVRTVMAAMLAGSRPPTAVLAVKGGVGRAAIHAMVDAGVVLDLAVFDEVDDPNLLVIPPSVVVRSDPARLGAAAAAMVLDRLDGLREPARHVVLEPLFARPGDGARTSAPPDLIREAGGR
jgi:LacI family transcriptional regulator